MSTKKKTRAFGAVGLLAVLAVVAAACVAPPAPPAQTTGNWKIEATTLTVVDDNNDCFGLCAADEPYLINLAFRVQFNTPNSASTFLVEDTSNELDMPWWPRHNGFPPGGRPSPAIPANRRACPRPWA